MSLRRLTRGRLVLAALLSAGLGLFAWLSWRVAQAVFVWRHYPATVVRCFGGRYNPCDVVVRVGSREFGARANLSQVHVGSQVTLAAPHGPPWSSLQQVGGPWGWVVLIISCVGVAATAAMLVRTLMGPRGGVIARHMAHKQSRVSAHLAAGECGQ